MEAEIAKASNLLVTLLTKIFSYTFGYIQSLDDNMKALEEGIQDLNEIKADLQLRICKAEREKKVATKQVTGWIKRLKKLEEEASDMQASYEKMSPCLEGCFPNVYSSYNISRKAEKKLDEVKKLKSQTFTEVAHSLVPGRTMMRPGGSVVGMDSALKQLQDYTKDDRVSTIGIYGMGGVGKTNLLEKFNNEFLHGDNQNNLYHVIWVDMSNCRTTEETQKAVTEELGLREQENKRKQERARSIFEYLHKKTFFLVLDNVWEPIDLKEVGIPTMARQPKSKIILTTRIEDVCASMDAKKVKVQCLGWEDAWSLFVEKTGEKKLIESNPRIRAHAEVLVKKCGGLPLALITLGRAMATRKTAEQWKHAIRALDIAPWEIKGLEKGVLSCLKRSYDNLVDEELRTCLLYCTLYPEGNSIYKESIIDYCIGEGVIKGHFNDGEEMYNKGHDFLGELRASSLLEGDEDEDYIKMHPMVRTLVLWIGSEDRKWLVRARAGLREVPGTERWKGAERISLMDNNITSLSERLDCPSLQTLLLQRNAKLAKICDGFFQSIQNLRVLDLSWTSITELPAEIGTLAGLQYFDVCGTPITKLPEELGQLVNLKFVLLSETPDLEIIPNGVIANLSQLQVLYMENSYGRWKVDATGDGVDFEEFYQLKHLKALDIVVESQSALEKLVGSHHLVSAIRKLQIKDCPTLIQFKILDIDSKALQVLQISDSTNLEDVVIDAGTDYGDVDEWHSLSNLHTLYLTQLTKAKFTWKSGCLENLHFLAICWCNSIERLIHEDVGPSEEAEESTQYPTRSYGRGKEMHIFPSLRTLCLYSLPEFQSLKGGGRPLVFPSLEVLVVDECPKLKKLELKAEKLQEIDGPKSWWDGLEWENDDVNKSKFLQIFHKWC